MGDAGIKCDMPVTETVQETNSQEAPHERLEVEEPPNDEEKIVWPSGPKLWLNMAALLLTQVLLGLDVTIVAVAIPKMTDSFNTIADIGWYTATYGLVASSLNFFFGKVYTVYSVKWVYLISLVNFELGSLLCTVAPTSAAFIAGRAIAGIGNSGLFNGMNLNITHSFPNHKRPLWLGIINGVFMMSMVSAPLVGGALIDAWTWRLCFGINLPLGVLAIGLTWYGYQDPIDNPDTKLPRKEKMKRLDPLGTLVIVPAITCLLIALQWGGTRYGWGNVIIIVLLVAVVLLLALFAWLQYKGQDKAVLPPRIAKNRSILAGAWYNVCINGTLSIVEQYFSIYFQAVKGYTPTKAGIMGVPLIIGMAIGGPLGGAAISWMGYYSPFMYITTILGSVAAGMLTTLDMDESNVKVLAFLGLLGFGIGLGFSAPSIAVQTILNPKDVPIGIAVVGFGGGIGAAVFICAAAALFQNRLDEAVKQVDPSINADWLRGIGLSEIRKYMSPARLREILTGYDTAVVQTLYMPLALIVLTIIGSVAMEWRSVKKKTA